MSNVLDIEFRIYDKSKDRYIHQVMRDILDGVGDDCPDSETSVFCGLALEGVPIEQVGEKNGKISIA